jgi:hypothetical protein
MLTAIMGNAQRTLADLVALDGWISRFGDANTATVHADVVFRKASFGSESRDKVRFTLTLRRAEIALCLIPGEPLEVMKATVRRYVPELAGQRRETVTQMGKLSGQAEFRVSTAGDAGAELAGKAEGSAERIRNEEVTEAFGRFQVQHIPAQSGEYRWEVRSRTVPSLDGSPWDAAEPRFSVVRTSSRNPDGDKPTLRVEVRCRREDLEISDLEAKDAGLVDRILSRPNRDVRIAAAEQLIKRELLRSGLAPNAPLDERLTELVVADAIIGEDW